MVNLPTRKDNSELGRTSEKLANIAGVSEKTYRMGSKVLNSDNEDVRSRVLSGETSISAGYKEIAQKKTEQAISTKINNVEKESKPEISDEVKQICADLKTEKTKEYLDSNWDYKSNFIECMIGDAEMFYDTFKSHLASLNEKVTSGKVTKEELKICIENANDVIDTLRDIVIEANNNMESKILN